MPPLDYTITQTVVRSSAQCGPGFDSQITQGVRPRRRMPGARGQTAPGEVDPAVHHGGSWEAGHRQVAEPMSGSASSQANARAHLNGAGPRPIGAESCPGPQTAGGAPAAAAHPGAHPPREGRHSGAAWLRLGAEAVREPVALHQILRNRHRERYPNQRALPEANEDDRKEGHGSASRDRRRVQRAGYA